MSNDNGNGNHSEHSLYRRSRTIRKRQRSRPDTTQTLAPLPVNQPLAIDPPPVDPEFKLDARSKFKPEFVLLGYKLALAGATEEQMATVFGVHTRTLEYWLAGIEEFKEAVQRGRGQADAEVAEALFLRAKGYQHPDVHFVTVRDKNGTAEVIATPTTKYYPPDVTACIFWLKNRAKDAWRDVYRQEHTGADGKPITRKLEVDLSKLTDAELALAESVGFKLKSKTKTDSGNSIQ